MGGLQKVRDSDPLRLGETRKGWQRVADLEGMRDLRLGGRWALAAANWRRRGMDAEIGHGSLASLGPFAYKVALPPSHFPSHHPLASACLTTAQPVPPPVPVTARVVSASFHPRRPPNHTLRATSLRPHSPVTRTMPSQTQKSESSASSTKSIPPEQLIALPSLACSLSSLPQAKSIDGLSLHPTMLAQRNAESQAKVTFSSSSQTRPCSNPVLSVAKSTVEICCQCQYSLPIRGSCGYLALSERDSKP